MWLYYVPVVHQVQPIILQVSTNKSQPEPISPADKASHRGIVDLPPATDARTFQQCEHVVKAVYTKLTQPDIAAIALTGIGGAGKSTIAALIYRYVEVQRQAQNGSFQAETLWFIIDPAVTFADLARSVKSSTLGAKAHH